ncbi:uncharacterized protein [Periplaneta americana]|uniref:uncharacterized protein n=1 Tax=Periplaneta americana TaxID=6978 RepID=UPI0037E72D88
MRVFMTTVTVICATLVLLQLCPATIAAQARILPGHGAETVQDTNTDRYNNGLLTPVKEEFVGVTDVPENSNTVTIIQRILQDRYLRSPVAVVIDTAAPYLFCAKKLLQDIAATNTGKNLVLIPYNGTGIGSAQKPMDMRQLQNAIQSIKPVTVLNTNTGGVAFYSMLKATEKVPFDSAILLFTGRAAGDEDLAQLTTQNLILKRCKLHVIWCGSPLSPYPGIEALYREVAQKTGGGFYVTGRNEFNQEDNPERDVQRNKKESTEVTLAMRLSLKEQGVVPIQVDKTITSLLVTIQGPIRSAILKDPLENSIDLASQEIVTQSPLKATLLAQDHNLLSVRLNTSVTAPGLWILTVTGADSSAGYNVIVKATSPLYFNATTSAIRDVTKHRESVDQNIQFQLGVPEDIAIIQSVNLVNRDGNKLSQLEYNPKDELIPAVAIPANKLSNEPLYLQLTANTVTGDVVQRLVEVKQQTTASYAIPYTVDVLPTSNIVAKPGGIQTFLFNVTNHHPGPTELSFTCQAKQEPHVFRQIVIKPLVSPIMPGRSIQVEVTALIFENIPMPKTAVLEFTARPYWGSYPVVSRAVYLYMGATPVSDSSSPSINYSIMNNCKNVPQESCSTAFWNMEATVQDSYSGLISVTSNPIGIEFQSDFIAGTKSPVPMKYSASCCAPTVDIKATDANGNHVTQHVDAYADKEGLTDAEIAAIILGVLLLVIIIIATILVFFLCKKRQSRNLQHSSH